jgi:hypothetical protein
MTKSETCRVGLTPVINGKPRHKNIHQIFFCQKNEKIIYRYQKVKKSKICRGRLKREVDNKEDSITGKSDSQFVKIKGKR